MTRQPSHADSPARLITGQLYAGVIVGLVMAALIVAVGVGSYEFALILAALAQAAALSFVFAGRKMLAVWRHGRSEVPGSLFAVGFAAGLAPMWFVLIVSAIGG